MRGQPQIGDEGELSWRVGPEHVVHFGFDAGATASPGVAVFSTPSMVLLMERAARRALQPYLESGEESVGVQVSVEHLAGTPLGVEVRGVARVTRVEGRMIDFEISAFDAVEQLGRGTHRRAIVKLDRVALKIQEKSALRACQKALPMSLDANSAALLKLETLAIETTGAIVAIRLNRPAKLNAINRQMTTEWEQVVAWLGGHPEYRVVLLGGNGRAFSAGDDVPEVGQLTIDEARSLSYRQARMYLAWEQLPQVFVGVVHGRALGAGCVAACACDFRLASHQAEFGMPEILLGWPPGYGVAQLTALVGKPRAIEMCVTGQSISARRALEIGLVNRLIAQGQLWATAHEFAQQLLKLPAEALRETKRLIHLDEGLQPKNAYLADTAAYARCLEQADAREGIAAFVAKRSPKFS